jgi:hypothetical protein
MQNVVHTGARVATCLGIANIAVDESKATSKIPVDREDCVDVVPMPGGKVVDADHRLPEIEQRFHEV